MEKFKKILLIDDNEIINFYNEDIISETGLFEEIVIITNGTDAINYFSLLIEKEEDLPDLTFLDIKMPDYDGFEILEELENMMLKVEENGNSAYLKKLKDLKICMLTTSQHKRDLELFENFTSALEYIEKPLTPEKIMFVIDHHLRK